MRRNLSHVQWREANPYGITNPVSLGMQLAMTLVFWMASCRLEDAMAVLDHDPLNPKLKRQWAEPDFQPDHPDGLRFNLPRWREALSRGQVEPVLAGDGWYVVGLRAWLGSQGGGRPEWAMSLSRDRLDALVETLGGALIFWDMPLTPPPVDEAAQEPHGTPHTDRTESPDEP